ncbi:MULTISPECIES: long-chain-fatty-acid--CoA ligase [Comamonas]|uniref:Long-chain-fatty-acid--CoA ligase n=1 Tax=Comamonas thiooxydans TaxID=363952 RepID=A0A0E3BFD9_9BURK|nr:MULTISPECIES: long-chain-fatty-acid--CoA ligase [Comamonas]EFI63539.1 long-chain-fatty-acid--CoA ligase [Comamonas thiooxydans]KGG85833.1 long-chain fatty acid--CoA ligase [Comamonas thiooxydans]KKI15767.1 long-chain fatty acid--CoA ligase [Comamonas thiooxydans]MCO8249385.1 long-chain-fatty-acid--CoA ligase [Comamonas thiooxydans]MDH1332955.1 long-chain-fatty-acid--CoA ligase [Comamonas thiooxydans]
MSDRPWLNAYPEGVPADIDASQYPSLVALMEEAFAKHADKVAYSFMGKELTFAQVDAQSKLFAAYLQSLGLQRGDRVALMMPNIPQYPVAVAGVLRAGYVLVNVNPLYTARELEHQLKDSGAKAIVIIENFAKTLQDGMHGSAVQHIVLCAMGDELGLLKGMLVNYVVRSVKKLVPPFSLPGAVRFKDALAKGRGATLNAPVLKADDMALLQYTGGTTGVSKGAVLLHRNIIANVLQSEAWNEPAMKKVPAGEQPTSICALPLYHIFAFTVNMMLAMRTGGKTVLIPNPRDLKATLKELSRHRFHSFPAVNTLFNGLANHPDFGTVDWSHLKVSVGGGMAVQSAVAELWLKKTGCPICEGYGLSETSPSVTCNPVTATAYSGTIGVPLPSTYVKLVGSDGQDVSEPGLPGEVAVLGPQVMAGYWQRPDETAKVMTADGYFLTGDIGTMDERGFVKIVDRKKDMVIVSGFNVYPNEVEDVVSNCPGVLECAVVGVPDEKSGEAIKLVVVKKDPALTEQAIRDYCHANLTGYKRPRHIVFRTDLPKTPVGKILRRELRDA